MSWKNIIKSSDRAKIEKYFRETKQGLYDMLLPTWEEVCPINENDIRWNSRRTIS